MMYYKTVLRKEIVDCSHLSRIDIEIDGWDNSNVPKSFSQVQFSEKVFENDQPIKARRAAIEYAHRLTDTINAVGDYLNVIQLKSPEAENRRVLKANVDNQIKLYGVGVFFCHGANDILVDREFISEGTLLGCEEELRLYELLGHKIGGSSPGTIYLKLAKRNIEVLPDVLERINTACWFYIPDSALS